MLFVRFIAALVLAAFTCAPAYAQTGETSIASPTTNTMGSDTAITTKARTALSQETNSMTAPATMYSPTTTVVTPGPAVSMAVPQTTASTTAAAPAAALAPASAPMQLKLSHGVTYVSGGVSQAEVSSLNNLQNEFNVQLTISDGKNNYVPNVTVSIMDMGKFELVKSANAGPYFFALLRPGTYYVQTTNAATGKSNLTKVVVGKKGVVKKALTAA